ncbi:D-aspartate oxidase-like [Watersipora subatra]|uniref:D-aspartate oxidase-like n=1 Tax=Watersipora subatra TaxID=2589382 RepID=UPI00355BF357
MVVKIAVVGAGAVGLSCAVRIKEVLGTKANVTIIADKFGMDTTSHVAAGVLVIETPLQISGYKGKRASVEKDIIVLSFNHYYESASLSHAEQAGIHKLEGYHIYYPGVKTGTVPFYTEYLRNWRPVTEEELVSKFPALPKGCRGHFLEIVVTSPAHYLPWLTQRFVEMGGKVKKSLVTSFDELWPEYDIVFNCCGVRANSLTDDTSLLPVRGQVIRAHLPKAEKSFAYITNGHESSPYFFWTPDGTVLGGIKQKNVQDTDISLADRRVIINATAKYFPHLNFSEDKIMREKAGLRPGRPAIRLEVENHQHHGEKRWVIHNYGHASEGIALSWGTACVAVEMLTDILCSSKL